MAEANPQNPWNRLPAKSPYVLPEDADLVHGSNLSALKRYEKRPDRYEMYQIRLQHILPEPYLGRPDAPVVLLNLNPGSNPRDIEWHSDPLFTERSRGNLLHCQTDYPFYLLDPSIKRTCWWERKLKCLMKCFGDGDSGRRVVANSVFCVEFFPYHSKKFNHGHLRLPSQRYSFWLVRQAIQRQAVILIMRSEKRWFEVEVLPELKTYSRLYTAQSVQNPAISERNFGEGFEEAIKAIRADRLAQQSLC